MNGTVTLSDLRLRVTLRRGRSDAGPYWVATCPGLPGCVSQGRTRAEALVNIRDAAAGWLATAQAHPEMWSKSVPA